MASQCQEDCLLLKAKGHLLQHPCLVPGAALATALEQKLLFSAWEILHWRPKLKISERRLKNGVFGHSKIRNIRGFLRKKH